jgi:hypothetical protein
LGIAMCGNSIGVMLGIGAVGGIGGIGGCIGLNCGYGGIAGPYPGGANDGIGANGAGCVLCAGQTFVCCGYGDAICCVG